MDTETHRWRLTTSVPAGRYDGSGGFQPAVESLNVSRHVVTHDSKRLRLIHRLILFSLLVLIFTGCQSTTTSSKTPPVISLTYESTHTYTISKRTGKRIKPGYEIQADGKCIIRSIAGDETLLKLPSDEATKMISFCENQGFFSISNESLDKLSQPVTSLDLQLVTNDVSGLVSMEVTGGSIIFPRSTSLESHAEQVTLSIQAGSLKNSISYYNLDKEIAYNTNVTQFQIIGRCLDEIHETIQKNWRRTVHPLTPLR